MLSSMSWVAVLGTGYVGATTAVMFAHLGHNVKAFDIDLTKIELLQQGKLPFYEPGLEDHLREGLLSGNLAFTENLAEALLQAEFVFICVPTPSKKDGSADMKFVLEIVRAAAPLLQREATVITKSTVPVGSAERISSEIGRSDIFIASNPEFLREGSAVYDFENPDRIVVGSSSLQASEKVAALYKNKKANVLLTDPSSAELIKYASNSFLAIKLSFVNEIARLCEALGASAEDVLNGFGSDSRIGSKFTTPGPGWGGSCFPKDSNALFSLGKANGVPVQMIGAALESNSSTKSHIVARLVRNLGGSVLGKKICVLGLTFKAFTDDIRDSPSLEIANSLVKLGAVVQAYDPQVSQARVDNLEVCLSPDLAIKDSEAILLLTEWPEFARLDPEVCLQNMSGKLVYDARNILNKLDWQDKGAEFIQTGLKELN